MMRFDRRGRATGKGDALDHVGIERPLREEIDLAELLRLLLEHLDEDAADGLPFRFRVADAGKLGEEARSSAHRHERNVVMAAEEIDDLARLVLAQEAMIDEDAGELIADRFMDEERGDGGIDAAGEAADDAPPPHLLAD